MNKIVIISAVLASFFATEAMADTYNTRNNNVRINKTRNYVCNGCIYANGGKTYRKITRESHHYEDHTREVVVEVNR